MFLNVLLTRLGVPIPAVPVLLFAGSAIAGGTLSFWPVLSAAVLAALIGDGIWFMAGRVYGRRLLAALERLSPSVGTQVRKARGLFERFGVALVSISKFVPGLALITPPLMGTTAVDTKIYVAWDFAGVVAWAAFWLLGGAAAEQQLHMLLVIVRARGGTVIDGLVALTLAYLAVRLIQRWRVARTSGVPGQAEAIGRLAAPPVILDACPETERSDEPRHPIPGALAWDLNALEQVAGTLPARELVVYCVCPNSDAARAITETMRQKGFTQIRALKGGIDAWQRRGFPIEAAPPEGSARQASPSVPGYSSGNDGAVTLRGLAPRQSSHESHTSNDKNV